MNDTFITIIVMTLVVLLMFMFPIIKKEDSIDTLSKKDIDVVTTRFINEIKTTGKLTSERYMKYKEDLNLICNTYNIQLEFKILDKNSENKYYSVFNSQIEEELNKNGVYNLKEGDIVSITINDTNMSLIKKITYFFNLIFGGKDNTIKSTHSGLVTSNGNAIEEKS